MGQQCRQQIQTLRKLIKNNKKIAGELGDALQKSEAMAETASIALTTVLVTLNDALRRSKQIDELLGFINYLYVRHLLLNEIRSYPKIIKKPVNKMLEFVSELVVMDALLDSQNDIPNYTKAMQHTLNFIRDPQYPEAYEKFINLELSKKMTYQKVRENCGHILKAGLFLLDVITNLLLLAVPFFFIPYAYKAYQEKSLSPTLLVYNIFLKNQHPQIETCERMEKIKQCVQKNTVLTKNGIFSRKSYLDEPRTPQSQLNLAIF